MKIEQLPEFPGSFELETERANSDNGKWQQQYIFAFIYHLLQ
jgi:hypothetical protein